MNSLLCNPVTELIRFPVPVLISSIKYTKSANLCLITFMMQNKHTITFSIDERKFWATTCTMYKDRSLNRSTTIPDAAEALIHADIDLNIPISGFAVIKDVNSVALTPIDQNANAMEYSTPAGNCQFIIEYICIYAHELRVDCSHYNSYGVKIRV